MNHKFSVRHAGKGIDLELKFFELVGSSNRSVVFQIEIA
jgi:hypothetical protein